MAFYPSKYLSAFMEKVRRLALCALCAGLKGSGNIMFCTSQLKAVHFSVLKLYFPQ